MATVTYCDIIRGGACIESVINWCEQHNNTFFLPYQQAVNLDNRYINIALKLDVDADRYGYGFGFGSGSGDGDGDGNKINLVI